MEFRGPGKGALLCVVAIACLFISCTHLQSGKYVQLQRGQSVKTLAKTFGVDKEVIKSHNKDKNFAPGEWIFIPLKRGIVSGFSGRSYASAYFSGNGKFIWPVPASRRVSSHYGRRWGRPHNGIDIAARGGSHILSTANGIIIYSGNGLRGFGNMIVIRHENDFYSIYAHNKKNFVRKGEKVLQGQVIGQVGNTGRSTGTHLHFEIRKGDNPLNPLAFFKQGKYKTIAHK